MVSTKQNTPGLGIEYEVHLPAYFGLLLNNNPEIEDFVLRSNVQDFGNLDDLLVDIKTKSGENLYFAFQLKHKEKSSKFLLPTNFEARGDFNLEKYCEAFKKLNKENKKFHFILYTNKNFDSSRINEVKKFDMKQVECCLGRNFFDTSGDGKHLYQFEVNEETEDGKNVNREDYREFFSRFTLYTGQASTRDLDKSLILDILKYKECYVTYIDFFRRWHRGDFVDKIIDKKTLNIHLLDILLSSVAINYHLSDGLDGNSIFFEAMVQQFDITIIDTPKQDFIKQLEDNVLRYPDEFNKSPEDIIKLGKMSKLIDKFTKELNEKTKLKLLHYFFQKPLILDFNESSSELIYEASKLCKIHENQIKLVILGRDIDASKFSHLKIFTNLIAVDEDFLEETKRRCSLSLQGRNISLDETFEDEIREFVTPREMFEMLKGSFSIGGNKHNLPECYIPRTVSVKVFDIEAIIKQSSKSAAIIFFYEDKFEQLEIIIQKILNREDYFYEDFFDTATILTIPESSKKKSYEDISKDTFPELPTLVLRKEECSRKQLEDICQEIGKDIIDIFRVIDGERCLLLSSTKSISYNENYKKFTKMSVEEKNIHVFFNSSINILCAQPGMGKSTLMKYLRNECDPCFWALRVDLKAHNQFLKRNHEIEEVLNNFLEIENCQDVFLLSLKKMFLRKKKIILFLDGLDEVENECVDRVLTITRQLSEMGFRIWLSSRQNLQQKVEQYFNTFAIEIIELNENQQKKYIENRLKSLYSKEEIQGIVEKIFNNADLADNRQILEIPLQLHIITEIFLDDKSYYSRLSDNNFILTKMFEIFFEGKYKHFVTKLGLKSPHLLGKLEEQLENYEIVALHSVLDDEHFQKLQIEKVKATLVKSWDFLGIIAEVNSENKAVFEHLTFAEYFASKFLVKNFDKVRILKEEIFAQKYQNILLIFNIMLAEDSPLHLAIIYKDLSRIEELGQSSLVDKGGRNFLQLTTCIATRHPRLESNPNILFRHKSYWLVKKLAPAELSECLVMDKPVQMLKGEDSKIREIVSRILPSEPFKKDEIYGWNSWDYALATGALYIVDAILKKCEKPSNFHELLGRYYSDEVVAYYSIRFGYDHLLSEIIAKKSCHVTGILSDYLRWKTNNSILHFLFFTSECTNRNRIIELLTGDDINKTVYEEDGFTFLHFGIFHDDTKFVKFLLEKKADVNIRDKKGKSPIFWAVEKKNFNISKLLVEKGADVNIRDKEDGKSPLFCAIFQDNFQITELLMEEGADANIKDKENGWSPLFLAVHRNNFEISKLLIEKGADVNIRDNKDGRTPLFFAVFQDNFEISKYLLEKGADPNIKDKEDGKTPLFSAVFQNNFQITKLLIEEGADINIKDKEDGMTPLFIAVQENNFEITKYLLEKGAVVNIKDKEEGRSSLFLAVERNNLKISKLLLEKGADVNIRDKENGWSPLFFAVHENNFEISKLLVEKGADVNIRDKKDGRTPLFLAVFQENFEISKLLVEKGADVNIKDKKEGRTPLFWAVAQNNPEISILLFINCGAKVNKEIKDAFYSLFLE